VEEEEEEEVGEGDREGANLDYCRTGSCSPILQESNFVIGYGPVQDIDIFWKTPVVPGNNWFPALYSLLSFSLLLIRYI
jgi:hypothetical protein